MSTVSHDEPEHHLPTLQAPVKALDPHGVRIVGLGTVVFVIGTLLCWWQLAALQQIGKEWWLSTALIGTGIGALALVVLLVRRRQRLS